MLVLVNNVVNANALQGMSTKAVENVVPAAVDMALCALENTMLDAGCVIYKGVLKVLTDATCASDKAKELFTNFVNKACLSGQPIPKENMESVIRNKALVEAGCKLHTDVLKQLADNRCTNTDTIEKLSTLIQSECPSNQPIAFAGPFARVAEVDVRYKETIEGNLDRKMGSVFKIFDDALIMNKENFLPWKRSFASIDYIDNIQPSDMSQPAMYGFDNNGRPFIALKCVYESGKDVSMGVLTIFDRYGSWKGPTKAGKNLCVSDAGPLDPDYNTETNFKLALKALLNNTSVNFSSAVKGNRSIKLAGQSPQDTVSFTSNEIGYYTKVR